MQNMRKCDKPKSAAQLDKRVVCPICGLPPAKEEVEVYVGKTKQLVTEKDGTGCIFFATKGGLKFEDDDAKRVHFIKFHHDFCATCRRDVARCRQIRTMTIKKRLKAQKVSVKNDGLFGEEAGSWASPEQMKKLVDAEPCQAPKVGYRAVKPGWRQEDAK